MTEVSQARTSTRWVLPFLAALIAALAAILLGTTASASAACVAETRVGAFNVAGEVLVGPPEHITAGQRLGNNATGPEIVVATGVAAKAGTEVAETCLNSFTGTTLVLMADGTKKPIRDVKLGDWVMAADPKTGETGPRKVVDLIRHSGSHTMVAVRLSDGSTIDATDKHPFWVETRGEWVDAIDLQPGDVVIDADGDRLTVTSLGISEQELTAYNLTVDGLHTYFAGSDSVLVHNAGCMSLADALATTHGQERLAARGFDNVDIAIARSSNLAYEQADGAIAHVAQLGDVYNVVIVGERGVVTGMKGLTENQLGNLARNYGWSGYP